MKKLLLTPEGCRQRQGRLRESLKTSGVDAAMAIDPHVVHYFTGWFTRTIFWPVLVVTQEAVTLAMPSSNEDPAAVDQRLTYVGSKNASIVDDQYEEALQALSTTLHGVKTLAVDRAPGALLSRGFQLSDLGPTLRKLKRTKLPDEVDVLRKSIEGAAAAFKWVRENLKPGVNELNVYGQMHAAATRVVGEQIGDFCNDIVFGAGGGQPRNREAVAGELLVTDISVTLRGYSSDTCRSFAVTESTETQREALNRCIDVLQYVESTAKPGTSCKALHEEALKMLDGYKGHSYSHHLGHGIGIFPHETPRLNNAWNDVLQEGDVFACEPGLYSKELRGGLRVEDNFLVTSNGVERLSMIDRSLGR